MNKRLIVRQQDMKDCGACCLLSIIKYYNGEIPMETIRLDTKTTNNGTTAYNIVKAAEKYGFIAKGEKIKNLKNNIPLPVIAHIITKLGYNHFVVIYKITKKDVYLMDPGKGFRKEKLSDFKKAWTNIILIFKPYKKIPYHKNQNSLKTLFLSIMKTEMPLIRPIIITDILITIISIVLSYYLQIVISIMETNSKNIIIFTIILFLGINIFKIIFEYYRNNYSIYLSKNIDIETIPGFISHLFKLPLSSITSRTSGEILTRIQEMNSIKNLFTKVLTNITLDLLLVIMSCIFLYSINNKLFLLLVLIAIIYVIVGITTNQLIYNKINENIDLETSFNSELTEKVKTMETIKNLNYVDNTLDTINLKYYEYEKNMFEYNRFQNVLQTIKNIVNCLGVFALNSLGIMFIMDNKLSVLSLITFDYLISYFLDPIENIIDLIPEYNLIKITFIKACETLNITEEQEGKLEKFVNGKIIFNNIDYSYDDYKKVLNKCSLSIDENDHLTLKGKSGIGKSTICQLLNGSITDYKGNITIDNINIKDYSLKTLRKNILYVSQREQLFNSSIKENILLGSTISKSELERILNITEVNEILEKKNARLETIIYDGGYNLSGGERQRIILARSLVKKPAILILDESLNEIEEEREKRILSKIDEYLKESTIIYISHKNRTFFKKELYIGACNE